jgi:hypothetical protein
MIGQCFDVWSPVNAVCVVTTGQITVQLSFDYRKDTVPKSTVRSIQPPISCITGTFHGIKTVGA